MKNLIIIAVILITVFGCTKQANKPTMNAEELKAKYGIVLPGLQYAGDEIAVSANRGAKKNASNQTVVVWLNDLVLSGSVSCTVSPDAQWGAIQKFLAEPLSNDGATVLCNFSYVMPSNMNCPTTAPGVYRGWTSDFDYNVHISNLITIP